MIIPEGKDIFKKVALSEKKLIFKTAHAEKIEISAKPVESEESFALSIKTLEGLETMVCEPVGVSAGTLKEQFVVANFLFNSERYFFYCGMVLRDGTVILRTDVELFRLQRRANARISIPDTYDAKFTVSYMKGQLSFIECRVIDVSAGGIRLEMPGAAPPLTIGERAKGGLRLGIRRSIDLEFEVRYFRTDQRGEESIHVIGAQFLGRDQTLENRFLVLMMDLQRELYLKRTK